MSGQQPGLEQWRARLRRLKLESIVFLAALFPVIMFGTGFSIYITRIETSGVLALAITMLISTGWVGLAIGTLGAYYELRQELAEGNIDGLSPKRRLLVLELWAFFAILGLAALIVRFYIQGF